MAQDISATSLATTGAAAAREVSCQVHICWGFDTKTDQWPASWSASGTIETDRILSLQWDRAITADPTQSARSPLASMTITLDNRDQRYSPYNTSSALYSSLTGTATTSGGTTVYYPKTWHVPIRLRMGFDSERVTVFSGYLESPTSENYGNAGDTLTLQALDRGAWLLERKASTTLYTYEKTDDWIKFLLSDSDLGNMSTTSGTFDAGVFTVPFCWLDNEDIYSELQDVASAEGGWFFFSEEGYPQFRNSQWWISYEDSTTSQWTFTTARFEDITMAYDWQTVATGAYMDYQTRAYAGEIVVFRTDDVIAVPTSGYEFDVHFVYPVDTDTLAVNSTLVGGTNYAAVATGGLDLTDDIDVELSDIYAQSATITITNNAERTVFVTFVQVNAIAVQGYPNRTITTEVTTPLVERKIRRIATNPYVQTTAQAEMLANLAANRMRYPRLMYRFAARAIPWLQVGDMITITASDPLSSSRTAIVLGLSFSWSPLEPFTMTVVAMDTAGLFEYTGYFKIGTHAYNAIAARLFY